MFDKKKKSPVNEYQVRLFFLQKKKGKYDNNSLQLLKFWVGKIKKNGFFLWERALKKKVFDGNNPLLNVDSVMFTL